MGIFMSFLIHLLTYAWLRLTDRLVRLRFQLLDSLACRWLLDHRSLIETLFYSHPAWTQRKQEGIDRIRQDQRIIYFTFRDLHLLDWFCPIDRALERLFPDHYRVFYVDFGSSLKKIGTGFDYLPYHRQIQQRLLEHGIDPAAHFSDREIGWFHHFPAPDLIVTSETIRRENFSAPQRVYLPHYTVPKAKDRLPEKIRYQHVFLPTRLPYSYNELEAQRSSGVQLHPVGYPKLHVLPPRDVKEPAGRPLVVYAPSLEIDIVLVALKAGLLAVFKGMTEIDFVIKLHPTLASKMRYLRHYIDRQIAGSPNIVGDSRSSIQTLGQRASVLIADFGSVGAEFRLSFGKRVLYLKVPDRLAGGADLRFRDAFADSITEVAGLAPEIRRLLALGDLSEQELIAMKDRVLFSWQNADETAARTIQTIIG